MYTHHKQLKNCMKPVVVRLKDLLNNGLSVSESYRFFYKPNGFTLRLFNVYNVYNFLRETLTCLPDLA